MYTLFLDTHGELVTISFVKNNEEFTKTLYSESHSTVLIPLIDSMLKEKNISLKEFERIIVINGPGSFTGLRIGLTVAKTLSYSLNIPIYTISSLKAYLISSDDNKKNVSVIEDPKGYYIGTSDEEYYTDSLDKIDDNVIVKNELNILKIVEYCKELEPSRVHGVKANYVKIIEVLK